MRVQFNWGSRIFLKRIYGFKHVISWNNFGRSDTNVLLKNFSHELRICLWRILYQNKLICSSKYPLFRAFNSIYIREAGNFSADEVILLLPWNKKICCRAHKSQQLGPILSKINPVDTLCLKLLWFTLIAYEYFRLPLSILICLSLSRFSTKFLLIFMMVSIFVVCAISLAFLYLIALRITGGDLQLGHYSLRKLKFLHPPELGSGGGGKVAGPEADHSPQLVPRSRWSR
jgi:hypothetical protein